MTARDDEVEAMQEADDELAIAQIVVALRNNNKETWQYVAGLLHYAVCNPDEGDHDAWVAVEALWRFTQ